MEDKLVPIFDEFEPLSTVEIADIEKTAEIELPETYKKFLREFGRCMFSGNATVKTGERELEIFTWFGGRGKSGSILEDLNAHPDYSEQNLVPIADTSFNDRYVLNGMSGEIYYIEYFHGYCNSLLVTSSFEDFIARINVEAYE